jgi:hypothetical protein
MSFLQTAISKPIYFTVALGIGLLTIFALSAPPQVSSSISAASIVHEHGAAFIAPLSPPVPWPFEVRGSGAGAEASGPLLLFQDGIPLGPADSSHDQIRRSGGGRYSHWGDAVYFSSVDGTHPLQHDYSYKVTARLKPSARFAGMLVGLSGVWGLILWAHSRRLARIGRRAQYAGAALAAFGALGVLAAVVLSVAPRSAEIVVSPSSTRSAGLTIFQLRDSCCYGLLAIDPSSVTVSRGSDSWAAAASASDLRVASDPGFLLSDGTLVVGDEGATTQFRVDGRWHPTSTLYAVCLTGVALGLLLLSVFGPLDDSPRFRPSWSRLTRSVGTFAIASLPIILVLVVIANWHTGRSGHLGVAGLMPVSDALGYYRCALQAGDAHHVVDAEWCSRRAVYPLALLPLLALSGWSAGVALLLQAAAIGGALALACREAWRAYGAVAAALLAIVGTMFIVEWALGTFMTEVYGLAAGLTGAALLVRYARYPSAKTMGAGLALLSLALTARAGAMFALPLLAIWAYVTGKRPARRFDLPAAALVAAALAAGPILQWVGAYHYVGHAGNTGGSFAVSLYGLSTGSRDWTQAYVEFAPLFKSRPEAEVFVIIQRRAIENVLAEPLVFVGAVLANFVDFGTKLFSLADFRQANILLTLLLSAGVAVALWRRREPAPALLLAAFAGECLSAPLIFDTGGARAFAATMWVRPLLAGVGAAALLAVLWRFARRQSAQRAEAYAAWERPAYVALAGSLILLPLITLISPAGVLRPIAVQVESGPCSPDETGVLARVGRESMALSIGTEPRLPISGPLVITPGRLERGPSWRAAWWSARTGPMPAGSTVVLAIDAQERSWGRAVVLYTDRSLPPSTDNIYWFCATGPLERELGDHKLRRVTSVATDWPGPTGRQ